MIALSGDDLIKTPEILKMCQKMGLNGEVTFDIATVRRLRIEALKGNMNAIKMIIDNDQIIENEQAETTHNELLEAIKKAVDHED